LPPTIRELFQTAFAFRGHLARSFFDHRASYHSETGEKRPYAFAGGYCCE
jgi:hypothetical protein